VILVTDSFKTFEDPLISLYQSLVREVAEKLDLRARSTSATPRGLQRASTIALQDVAAEIAQREYAKLAGGVQSGRPAATPRDLSKPGIAKVCAELAFRYMKACATNDQIAVAQLADEFKTGTCDPAWLSTLEEYRLYVGSDGRRKVVPYIRAADIGSKTIEIKAGAKIALIGDWATGARPAVEVLRSVADTKPDIVVHVGDIYYSGTPAECDKHFAEIVTPILRRDSNVPFFTLSGNHDMYCGGAGFYSLIRKLNSAPFEQSSSFFCLRSSDQRWQLLAMDTGLHDDNPSTVADTLTFLEEDELVWHCDRIKEFPGRTILLSHHQLFSAYSPIGPIDKSGKRSPINPRLHAAFKQMSATKDVAAWFWGHEHTLSIYEPYAGLSRGRCIGHGAVPVSVQDPIYSPLTELDDAPIAKSVKLGTQGGVYNHGFAILELRDDSCEAVYMEVTGKGAQEMYREVIA
jgi:Calcineurin-like phosphoesterase